MCVCIPLNGGHVAVHPFCKPIHQTSVDLRVRETLGFPSEASTVRNIL